MRFSTGFFCSKGHYWDTGEPYWGLMIKRLQSISVNLLMEWWHVIIQKMLLFNQEITLCCLRVNEH